jgi:hypothetical protein
MAGLAFSAERQGIVPSAGQVVSFKVAPVLGGAISAENIEVMNFEVIVHITGQLHQQIRDMPPGAHHRFQDRACAAGTEEGLGSSAL